MLVGKVRYSCVPLESVSLSRLVMDFLLYRRTAASVFYRRPVYQTVHPHLPRPEGWYVICEATDPRRAVK